MTGLELLYLLGALAAVGSVIFVIRRAAIRSQLGPGGQSPKQLELGTSDAPSRAKNIESSAKPKALSGKVSDPNDDADEADERASTDSGEPWKQGLAKTRGGFVARLGHIFGKKQIDSSVLAELEEVLLTADIGPKTADKLFQSIKKTLSKQELASPDAIWQQLRKDTQEILSVDAPPVDFSAKKPFVLLVLGVNGVGKTTTIGKLAAKLSRSGKKVLLAAGDTFRAAAAEQLEIWGERAGCPVVRGKSGGDPSSVIFDAIKRAQAEDFDIVIADTAGRLHTKVDLMEELKKVGRVIAKAMPDAPHETWLVVDSTTGQNAINQAQLFKEAMAITGVVLTKLDGTAKGGVILGICDELSVPVRFVGIGESVDDLREFDPAAFVSALYDTDEVASHAA